MSDVIDFLERMGQDAQLRHASHDEMESAMSSSGVAPVVQTALLAKDQSQLEALLGRVPLCAVYFPGQEDEEQGDETEEAPSREPHEAPEGSGLQTAKPAC